MKPQNIKGALLLSGGIMIGVVLTAITFHVFDPEEGAQNKSLAAATPAATEHHAVHATHNPTAPQQSHAVHHQAPGAAYAQAPHSSAAPAGPQDWLKPEDVAAQAAGHSGSANGAQQAPKYQSSHTTYYVYGSAPGADTIHAVPSGVVHNGMPPVELTSTVSGYPIPIGAGPRAIDYPATGGIYIGDNGMIQNPCVDPPSVTRSRAYRQIMKH